MNEEQIEEARRWVALPGWRWMRGMTLRWRSEGAPGEVEWISWLCRWSADCGPFGDGSPALNAGLLPDLNDPATRGCLLALAREMTGDPWLEVRYSRHNLTWAAFWTLGRSGCVSAEVRTETAALLAAVEDYYRAQAQKET